MPGSSAGMSSGISMIGHPPVFLTEDGSRRILSVGSDPDQFDETGDGGMYAR